MADVMTPEQRSRCMSRIRGRDTSPEILLRRALWARGLRYKLRYRIAGKPDIVFVREKIAVFVDGCFWHCCPKHSSVPKNNALFWQQKLHRNLERDVEVNGRLRAEGWTVIRVWEHSLRDGLQAEVASIASIVKSSRQELKLAVPPNISCTVGLKSHF